MIDEPAGLGGWSFSGPGDPGAPVRGLDPFAASARLAGMRTHLLVPMIVSLLLACGPSTSTETSTDTQGTGNDQGTDTTGAEGTGPVSEGDLVIGTDACTSDADCAPADCCHPASCVARASAPSCADTMCTMECRGDTMDCGGGCLCHEGHCAARGMRISRPELSPQ